MLRIWPEHADSLNNLGTAVWRQGRLREAETFIAERWDSNPTILRFSITWETSSGSKAGSPGRSDCIERPSGSSPIRPRP